MDYKTAWHLLKLVLQGKECRYRQLRSYKERAEEIGEDFTMPQWEKEDGIGASRALEVMDRIEHMPAIMEGHVYD